MKIRNGFVSNSSSTSFCIVGMQLEQSNFNLFDKNSQLITYYNPICDCKYVGVDICKMKNEQTLLQFKHKVLDILQLIDPTLTIKNIGIIYDGWYDG